MPLYDIQLAAINPIDRATGKFEVIAHSDDGNQLARFNCTGEGEALRLRNAIREHADCLHRVGDYRPQRAPRGDKITGLVDALRQARAELLECLSRNMRAEAAEEHRAIKAIDAAIAKV